jgi:hypothetical protein
MLDVLAYFDDCDDEFGQNRDLWIFGTAGTGQPAFLGRLWRVLTGFYVYIFPRDVGILCDLWPYIWGGYCELYLFYSCHCNDERLQPFTRHCSMNLSY